MKKLSLMFILSLPLTSSAYECNLDVRKVKRGNDQVVKLEANASDNLFEITADTRRYNAVVIDNSNTEAGDTMTLSIKDKKKNKLIGATFLKDQLDQASIFGLPTVNLSYESKKELVYLSCKK